MVLPAGDAGAYIQVRKSQVQNFWNPPTIPDIVRLFIELDETAHKTYSAHDDFRKLDVFSKGHSLKPALKVKSLLISPREFHVGLIH